MLNVFVSVCILIHLSLSLSWMFSCMYVGGFNCAFECPINNSFSLNQLVIFFLKLIEVRIPCLLDFWKSSTTQTNQIYHFFHCLFGTEMDSPFKFLSTLKGLFSLPVTVEQLFYSLKICFGLFNFSIHSLLFKVITYFLPFSGTQYFITSHRWN